MKPSHIKSVIEKCLTNQETLMIKGAPGIGKTRIISKIAEERGYKGICIDAAISSPTDFKGIPMYNQSSDTASFKPYDILVEMINTTDPTLVFFDDFGLATPSVQGSVMHLLSERRVGHHQISDNVTFMIATNEQKQNAGVGLVLEPVKSRCLSIIALEPDVEDWISWAYQSEIHPHVIGFIRFRPEMLWSFEATNDLTNSPSPRTNEHVSKILSMGLAPAIEHEMIEGAAGSGYAIEFAGYKKMAESIVSLDHIIENPHSAEVPSEPSILYATTTALAYRVDRKNLKSMIDYSRRMPEEFALKFIEYDIMSRDESLKETSEYAEWVVEYQDLLKN